MPFYGTVLVGVFVAAIICPRIPPLSKMKNEYYGPVGKQIKEEVPNNQSTLSFAFERAVQKAAQSDKPVQIVKKRIVQCNGYLARDASDCDGDWYTGTNHC
ncbi:hypothetical protein [Geomicrobium sp. JCM 19055]|uniref:hypothetical protein n=1 Tax=Geomicrobium sp. JCM 19055 TaxID=1460649 RepID=UPI002235BF5A|nr:hypothetical protein [Geomicrobium sp. JCM 19055]